jgi:hypothetical protein
LTDKQKEIEQTEQNECARYKDNLVRFFFWHIVLAFLCCWCAAKFTFFSREFAWIHEISHFFAWIHKKYSHFLREFTNFHTFSRNLFFRRYKRQTTLKIASNGLFHKKSFELKTIHFISSYREK